jgi:uncharacterized protein YndB with AHSA1/START domain
MIALGAGVAALASAPPLWAGDAVTSVPIHRSVVVDAPVSEVWETWTTSRGVPTFMGLDAEIELKPRGTYRVVFVRDGKTPLERGNDGQILAFEPMEMLSISWMTPMFMPELSGQSMSIVLRFMPLCGGRKTRVDLINGGYGSGPKWREAYAYNARGWVTVLSRLAYRFKYGPINWDRFAQDSKDRMATVDHPIDRSNESVTQTSEKYC